MGSIIWNDYSRYPGPEDSPGVNLDLDMALEGPDLSLFLDQDYFCPDQILPQLHQLSSPMFSPPSPSRPPPPPPPSSPTPLSPARFSPPPLQSPPPLTIPEVAESDNDSSDNDSFVQTPTKRARSRSPSLTPPASTSESESESEDSPRPSYGMDDFHPPRSPSLPDPERSAQATPTRGGTRNRGGVR